MEVIRQIALTNQLTVSWEVLRKALKDELEQVLKSNQLTYTASRVTNPLTTTLTAIPNTVTTAEEASPIVDVTTTGQEQGATGGTVSADATTKTSEDDQPHVPEHNQEKQKQEATSTADSVDKKTEESTSQTEGEQTTSTGTVASKDDTPGAAEIKHKDDQEESNGPASVEKQGEDENKDKEKLLEQQEQGQLSSEDTANVVPISINTLLLETPQGYHDRIRRLLDAFLSAPFTIQRVCELISSPTEHHTNLIKYLRAVEKVLMITSSINEFSNPAYNGPSALDEKDDEALQHVGDRTVNGDYSQSKNLDFSLISTKRPSSDGSDDEDEDNEFGAGVSAYDNSNINDKEAYDAVLAEVDAFEEQFGTGKEKLGNEGVEEELEEEEEEEKKEEKEEEEDLPALNAAGNATEATTTATGDVTEMDVDDDQAAGGATGATSTMEGVESESTSEAAIEGSMEVDQV
ncbi:protein phosphatase 4, regulatory subunit 2 [Linnemannia schmuckeri]|uniref:Protein phosphatase 4, regulatory subunit 2 n=1 Tax=Linnemannia schmuckeri TaxID=64567 RepID=A0A9P5RWU3_9FUNG|nr:protein phosphatase 4, regulatory subunit 2 [Linnemannia schmuckeri]